MREYLSEKWFSISLIVLQKLENWWWIEATQRVLDGLSLTRSPICSSSITKQKKMVSSSLRCAAPGPAGEKTKHFKLTHHTTLYRAATHTHWVVHQLVWKAEFKSQSSLGSFTGSVHTARFGLSHTHTHTHKRMNPPEPPLPYKQAGMLGMPTCIYRHVLCHQWHLFG